MKYTSVVFLILLLGCVSFVIDPSPNAVDAGDLTLVSTCNAIPVRGMDMCLFKDTAPINSSWTLVVPHDNTHFLGGEITLYFGDLSKSYAITSDTIEISWAEFFKSSTWNKSLDGEVLAVAKLRYKNDEGIEEVWRGRGIAKIIITSANYNPVPLDSGYIAFEKSFKCRIGYTTSGRSAVECKP